MAKENTDLEDSSSSPNFCLEKCSIYKKQRLAAPNSAASKFMSLVSDDLFLEILLRFPDGRSVMQCATVCKGWCSLIINPNSRKFKVRFIQYHLRKQSLDSSYNTVFLFNNSQYNYGPYYQLCSDRLKHYDLSFMMNSGDLAIRAASDDLLLLSSDDRHYFICNSLTKECLALPELPRHHYLGIDRVATGSFGFAIVKNPLFTDEDRYKVVIVHDSIFDMDDYENDAYLFEVAIFDLETGRWTMKIRYIPYPMNNDEEVDDDYYAGNRTFYIGFEIAVDGNGILHWLDGEHKLVALFVLDPFSLKSSYVDFPCSQFNDLITHKSRDRVRLGVVKGQVRLSLMEDKFRLKVWELISESKTWVLVYDFDFEKTSIGKGELFFVLAFDPNDGNVVVLVQDEHIYMYEIQQDKYDKVCEFPYDHGQSVDENKQRVAMYLKVMTPVHPFWGFGLRGLVHAHLLEDMLRRSDIISIY